jgi:hypothetical protein
MKLLIGLFLLTLTTFAQANVACSVSIKDNYGFEYEVLTRYSYSREAACSEAHYACRQSIAEGQTYGRYYDAFCVEQNSAPNPPPRPPFPPNTNLMCTTDLVDTFGSTIRSFTGYGRTEWEACGQSDEFCRYELSRGDSFGKRCLTRGIGNGPGPRPPRQTTEQCTVNRYDPAGYFIQSYFASHTGPVNSDVKGEACRKAINTCSYDIRGRQTCRIDR